MKITELTLQTHKLEDLYDFYSNTLRMHVMRETKTGFVIFTPGTLLKVKQVPDSTKPYYHFAFNIPSNKIEEAATWLQQKVSLLWMDDYRSNIADFTNWHAKVCVLFRPRC
ncbi:hypothetical protein BH10BAC3_BH10BAC3_16850 [soil metagenome]